jgi:thymidylate synthase
LKSYLSIVEDILTNGKKKNTRTGTDVIGISGAMFSHDMGDGFPLLTTKKMSIKNIAVELEFFIKGLSSKKWLQERGCHIWDQWCNPQKVKYGSDEATKKAMFDEDDLGKIYGRQWRDFNGVDQLQKLVTTLKKNPNDRRMLVSSWNPAELDQMALPPCHLLFQVVAIDGVLNLNWYQRSVDTMLGLPYNIASYGLLLELLSKESGLIPGRLCGMLGDVHIYENHIELAKVQLSRTPKELPNIKIDNFTNVFDWTYDAAKVENYNHYDSIKFDIAV